MGLANTSHLRYRLSPRKRSSAAIEAFDHLRLRPHVDALGLILAGLSYSPHASAAVARSTFPRQFLRPFADDPGAIHPSYAFQPLNGVEARIRSD